MIIKTLVKNSFLYKPLKTLQIKLHKNKKQKIEFQPGTRDITYEKDLISPLKKVAIIACFSKNGFVPIYLLSYIDELNKLYDGVILIGDCPIYESEIDKIKDKVIYCSFSRHGEYDFGSYKRGYQYLVKKDYLKKIDSILLTNDSCFGPLFNLKTILDKMEKKHTDFWGLALNNDIQDHLQSWFLVIKKNVIQSKELGLFLNNVKKQRNQWDVVLKYEIRFTKYLEKHGFSWSYYLSPKDQITIANSGNIMLFPATLLRKYKFPFIKIKIFSEYTIYNDQRKETLDIIKKINRKYYLIIYDYLLFNNFDLTFLQEKNSSKATLESLKLQLKYDEQLINKLKKENESILASKRWKVGSVIAFIYHLLIHSKRKKSDFKTRFPYFSNYQENIDFSKFKTKVKVLAFYLPQYHTFKENNEWWGEGFTEWTNAKKSLPRFANHYQPRLPHNDIGFYDLSHIETIKKQAELAMQHGIYGFIFYYYWFSGKLLMEKPINMLIDNPDINIKFCLCWANENWTRAWDGQNKDILIAQEYSQNDPKLFIKSIKKYVQDKRYIKIDNKPVIFIYNPYKIPDINNVISLWRAEAKAQGIGEIYVVTRNVMYSNKPSLNESDAEFDFPPINHALPDCHIKTTSQYYAFDYKQTVDLLTNEMLFSQKTKPYFYTSTMGWDNSSRRKKNCFIFYNYDIESFYKWNVSIVKYLERYPSDKKILLVNAWNEWCEGTYLEPDQKYGYANINTLSKAIYNIPYNPTLKFSSKTKYDLRGKRIAIHVHLFHTDLIGDIVKQLNFMPYEFDCFVSTDSKEKKTLIEKQMKNKLLSKNLYINVYPNRGRDVAPFIFQMKLHYEKYDYICHVHSKKTQFGSYGGEWRDYLYNNLFGSSGNIAGIFKTFEENPNIGIIYPPTFSKITDQVTDYNGNYNLCKKICKKINIPVQYLNEKLVFPSGTMFWAKTDAIKPIFSSKIKLHNFSKENNQTNATFAHAIERMLTTIAISQGYTYKNTTNIDYKN